MPFIYVVVNDLFFGERLRGALAHLGYRGEVVDLSMGAAVAVPPDADLVVVDLEGGEPALAAIRAAREAGRKILAFGPHTDLALREAGLAAGADRVVAKSKLTASFPELVAEFTANG